MAQCRNFGNHWSASVRSVVLPIIGLLLAAPAIADLMGTKERQLVKVADGVYVIRHNEDPSPGFILANTTVIVGEREVFVVDSGQTSAQARQDVAEIRQLTDKPVRYLLNTHWHTDHNGGNHEYMAAFPSIAIIATGETRKMMDEFAPSVLAYWLRQATASRDALTRRLETGKGPAGKPLTGSDKKAIPSKLKMVDDFIVDAKSFVYQPPTLTFEHELTINIGANREVQLLFLGRANTGGDAIVYLPKERVLIAGDVVDYPVPFAFDGYPSEWIQTLRKMAEFDAQTIIPGHGQVLHDKTYLYQVADLMNSVVSQVRQQFRANPDVTLEEVRRSIDLSQYRTKFAQGDQSAGAFFDSSIRDSFVELVYHERKQR